MFLDNPQVVVVLVQIGGDLGEGGRGRGTWEGEYHHYQHDQPQDKQTSPNSKPILLQPFGNPSH